jgi:hypothetical protein
MTIEKRREENCSDDHKMAIECLIRVARNCRDTGRRERAREALAVLGPFDHCIKGEI